MSEKIIIKKTTVVPSTVKVTGKKEERVISDGKWIVGVFTSEGAFLTGAEYMRATGDVDGKYGRDWASKEYAQHYAHELATREGANMSAAVTEGLEDAEEKWEKAEKKRQDDAQWRRDHKSEYALEGLKKKADAVAKMCKKDEAVKKFADYTADKAGKFVSLLQDETIAGEGIVKVDDALAFLAKMKADKAARPAA